MPSSGGISYDIGTVSIIDADAINRMVNTMIIDAVMYNGEKDVLKIRRAELDDVVDHRVVVSGCTDFRGRARTAPTAVPTRRETWSVFPDPFFYHPSERTPWERECAQRNSLLAAVEELNPQPDDKVIISDVDEIPARAAINALHEYRIGYGHRIDVIVLPVQLFYYRLNLAMNHTTPYQPVIATVQALRECLPQQLRENGANGSSVPIPGWHFSFLGDVASIQRKIHQFAHEEYDTEQFTADAHIEQCIKEGLDIFGRGYQISVTSLDSVPQCIRDDPGAWEHLIWKP